MVRLRSDIQVANDWGYFNTKTNAWTGAIASILNGTADLSLSSATHARERTGVVDFNFPTQAVT
jgi:hypothetical protein